MNQDKLIYNFKFFENFSSDLHQKNIYCQEKYLDMILNIW